MKKLVIFIMSLAIMLGICTSILAADVIIGTGTSTQSYPFDVYYGYSRSASLYLQSEITQFGVISQLAWYVGTARTTSCPIKIYLKTTSATTLTSNTWANFISGATLVYDGTYVFSSTGWNVIDITDYNYTSDNLLVLCEGNYGGIGTSNYPTFRYTTSTSRHGSIRADNTPPTGSLSINSNRPNITITFPSMNDFSVFSLSTTPSMVHVGDNVSLNATIKNVGDGAQSGKLVSFYIDGNLVGTKTTGTINPGMTETVSVPWNPVTAGSYNFTASLPPDDYNGNNTNSISISVLPLGVYQYGTGNTNAYLPIHPYYGFTYSQTIYPQSWINLNAKQIEKIWWYWNGAASAPNTGDIVVYMGHTNKTAFASTTDWVPLSQLTQVFSGSINLPATAGWIEIPLSQPFVYNNTQNLVIATDENRTGYDSSSCYFFSTLGSAGQSIYYYSDSTNPNPASPPSGTLSSYYPNTRLYFNDVPQEPVFSMSPNIAEWPFGTVIINTSNTKTFTITNTGQGNLEITSLTLTGHNFYTLKNITPDWPWPPLGNNQSGSFTVEYKPTAEGTNHTATVTIRHSLSPDPVTIQFSGSCIDPTMYVPSIQNFSSSPVGWTVGAPAGSYNWGLYSYNAYGNPGTGCAGLPFYSISAGGICYLYTPPLNIGRAKVHLKYDYAYAGYSATGYVDKLQIFYSTNGGTSFTQLVEYLGGATGPLNTYGAPGYTSSLFVPTATQWATNSLELPAGTNMVAFVGVSGYGNNLYIDNVRLVYEGNEIATGIPVGGTAVVNSQPITSPTGPIGTSVTVSGLSGTPTVTVQTAWAPQAMTNLSNSGVTFALSGTNFSGTTVTIMHNLGFIPLQLVYRILPSTTWNLVTPPTTPPLWTTTQCTFTISGKSDGDLIIVLPDEEGDVLPVEMSSFTATLTAEYFVNLAWVVQSETNHMGYNVLRSYDRVLNNAIVVNPALITQGSSNGSEISYSFIDKEVQMNTQYYYWLENISLNGTSEYYGPISVTVGENQEEPAPPVIPIRTALLNAYPNPFNPMTSIRFTMKEAGTATIDIFNVKGQLIRSFSKTVNRGGTYSVIWDGKDSDGRPAASGVYMYRMQAGNYTDSKKMILSK